MDEGHSFGGCGEGVDEADAAMYVEGAGCLGSVEDEVPRVSGITAEEEGGCAVVVSVFVEVGFKPGFAKSDVFEKGVVAGVESGAKFGEWEVGLEAVVYEFEDVEATAAVGAVLVRREAE